MALVSAPKPPLHPWTSRVWSVCLAQPSHKQLVCCLPESGLQSQPDPGSNADTLAHKLVNALELVHFSEAQFSDLEWGIIINAFSSDDREDWWAHGNEAAGAGLSSQSPLSSPAVAGTELGLWSAPRKVVVTDS